MEYDEKKHSYDSTALQLQSNMSKIEGEVERAMFSNRNRNVSKDCKHDHAHVSKVGGEVERARVAKHFLL